MRKPLKLAVNSSMCSCESKIISDRLFFVIRLSKKLTVITVNRNSTCSIDKSRHYL